MQTEEILPFMKELAKRAAVETLPRFRALSCVDNKREGGFDPVTEADREAERVIRDHIMATFPGHGIEGEEFGCHNHGAEYCWVIDPVDGTRAFIAGIPVWGTLIGLCQNGKPVAGIMAQPFTGELYHAANGESWFEHRETIKANRTSRTASLGEAILMTTAPELFAGTSLNRFNRVSQQTRLTRYGADCYAYCQLASGNVDLVIERGLGFYDVAALIPIMENAGGIVTNWEGGAFGESGEILAAANREIHAQALELLMKP